MAIKNKLSFDNDRLIPDNGRCSCHLWMSFMRQTLLINHHCEVSYVTVPHADIWISESTKKEEGNFQG